MSKRLNEIKKTIAHGKYQEAIDTCDGLAMRLMSQRDNLNTILADLQGLRQKAERGITNATSKAGSKAAEIGRRRG